MNAYYLWDGKSAAEKITCADDAAALRLAQTRNRWTRGANWKAYDDRGRLIVGVCRMNQTPGVEFTITA